MINYSVLRRMRKSKNLNLDDVAKYLDYASASSYHRLENGLCRPTVSQVRKLCELYNVTWEELLGPLPGVNSNLDSPDKS